MRAFLLLMLAAAVLTVAGFQVPTDRLEMRVLRWALFIGAGIFAALLLSAMVQALLGLD